MARIKSKWNVGKLKEIMEARDIKQKDIADILEETPQLISYYFRSNPTIYTAGEIARALSTKENPVVWRDLIV